MTQPGADPLVGRTVAHYEIVSRLGGGGMGVVYHAVDRKLGRPVALKFLPQQWSHDDSAKQRFVREAQTASATNHPNICTIHDIATADDGQLFIVMAHYSGDTLKHRLESGSLPVDEALDIATQVADGLARAHAQGVVHRDIKPGNLILTEDGVRIVDFGLATFVDALQLTVEGSTLGTAAYMSPEQVRGQEVDARSDVWAVGVVLYQMLVGHTPFRGAYAEAIGHAIRNEPPPPLRAERPEIPEEVEQLVFRALHKDPAIRFPSGRELARALRAVRGLTVPMDLRTEVVAAPARPPVAPRNRRTRIALAVAVMVLLVGAPTWVLLPVEPVPVAVTPLVNGTGLPDLDGYEFALAEELAARLRTSRAVRVLPPQRVREILTSYRAGDADFKDRTAAQAIADGSGARFLLIPELVQDDGEFRVAIDVWDTRQATSESISTPGETSSRFADTAYALTLGIAPLVEDYFAERGPLRMRVWRRVRDLIGAASLASPRVATLAAAAALERGLDAYDRLEYDAAVAAFTEASKLDPKDPLAHAWRSRTLLLMRDDAGAATAGREASQLLAAGTFGPDRLLVEAIAAEGGGDTSADERYAALLDEDEQDTAWLMERGGFLERRGRFADAIAVYQKALEIDPAQARPELELCRLYGPTRGNELVRARDHADRALAKYQKLRAIAQKPHVMEAQALMCRADVLSASAEGRLDARRDAETALAILEAAGARYQRARALYYLGLAAGVEGRAQDAVTFNDQALTDARATDNGALEPLLLRNLGVAHRVLGNRRRAIDYYRLSSDKFQALGDERNAADMHANAAAILIEFGDDPALGLRLVETALKVAEREENTRSEVFALQVSAAYYRNVAEHREAEQRLNRAITLAGQRKFTAPIPSLTLDLARSRFERGDYIAARDLILSVLDDAPPRDRVDAQLRLALTEARLGDFAAARARLAAVAASSDATKDVALRVSYRAAAGELEYEADRIPDARQHFAVSAREWGTELPNARAVEAHAYVGLLDALSGKVPAGIQGVETSLAQAQRMGRLAIEARCRVFLARIAVKQRQFDEAVRVLSEVPPDDDRRTIGPELRAQAHYWRGQALRGRGDAAAAGTEISLARALIEGVRAQLPEAARAAFSSRTDMRAILQ